MSARPILIAAALALAGGLAAAPPAEAGHLDWSFGVGFQFGGLHFRVGFAPPGRGIHPGPFFLTTSRLHYGGYSCHDACFRGGAGYYHHASCPLVDHHFRRGGYGPDYFLLNFSPHRYSPYRGWGRGHYRGYSGRSHLHRYPYRDGYRHRFRGPGGHHYRSDRHHRDRYRYRGGYDYDDDSDSDSDRRDYRRGRDSRGHDGDRDRAVRRGAVRTRPPH